jgi:hypothetical protein
MSRVLIPAAGPAAGPAAAVLLTLLVSTRVADAGCPHAGARADDDVCRPWTALFLPTAVAMTYAPDDMLGTWVGAGAEVVMFAWSDSSEAFGPSHGKLRFDAGLLRSGEDGAGTMIMYRGGVQVSIERNAARRWLIPYVASDLGGLWTDALGTRGFVDAGLGVYLWHARSVIVDAELAYLLPFADVEQLGGLRAQLAVSVALW